MIIHKPIKANQIEQNLEIPIIREDIKDIPPLIWNKKEKRFLPNPILAHTTPYWFTFNEINGTNEVTVPANSTVQRNIINDKTALIDLRSIAGVATSNNYLVKMYDSEYQRDLSNNPLHAETIIGSGIFPFDLPIPLILHRTQSIFFFLTDLSGTQNKIRINFSGLRYYFDIEEKIFSKNSEASRISRPYFYTTNSVVNLPVSTAIQHSTITIISEADFYLYVVTSKQDGPFLIKFTDSATGFSYMNGFIHSSILFGNAQNYRDIEPMLIQRSSIIQVEFINLHDAPNNVYLTLCGANYYYER